MEDNRIHLVLFIAILAMNEEIVAKAVPKTRFTLPHDDYAKGFIRELSKESPDYEKLGKFVKEFYFEWNGLKDARKTYKSPSSNHGNSNATKTNEDFRRNEDRQGTTSAQGGRNRRHWERDTHANVSLVIFTPSPNIPGIPIGYEKKRSSKVKNSNRIYSITNNRRVVKRSKKDMVSGDKITFSPTELINEKQVKNEQQTVPSISIEYKRWWNLKKTLGVVFIFVWMQVVILLLYSFCWKRKYDNYVCLPTDSEADQPTISQIVNNLSSEPISSDQTEPGTKELSKNTKNKLKALFYKGRALFFKDSQSEDESEDGESPRTYRQKNIKILKKTFSQILSSEPIPKIPSSESFDYKAKKITIVSNDHENNTSTKTTTEKDENGKHDYSAPVHEDIAQTHVKQLYYDTEDTARPEHQNRSQGFSATLSNDKNITSPNYLDTSHTFEEPEESKRNMVALCRPIEDHNEMPEKPGCRTFKHNPEEDGSVLKENLNSLHNPIAKGMTKEENRYIPRRIEMKPEESNTVQFEDNPYQEQRRKVTFSRVIEAKTFSSKSKCGQIAGTFHRVDGRKPWKKSPSKCGNHSNYPKNSPTFIYPRRTRIDQLRSEDDEKTTNSLLKRLKRKFKK